MDAKLKEEWVKALRSEEYRQAKVNSRARTANSAASAFSAKSPASQQQSKRREIGSLPSGKCRIEKSGRWQA